MVENKKSPVRGEFQKDLYYAFDFIKAGFFLASSE